MPLPGRQRVAPLGREPGEPGCASIFDPPADQSILRAAPAIAGEGRIDAKPGGAVLHEGRAGRIGVSPSYAR